MDVIRYLVVDRLMMWLLAGLFVAGVCLFQCATVLTRQWGTAKRGWFVFLLSVLSLPAASFSVYYLHLIPDTAGYFAFRSLPGVEWVLLIPAGAAGVLATFVPKWRFALLVCALLAVIVPFLKPLLKPVSVDRIGETWTDDVCLQSSQSTCGPASAATLLRQFGVDASESELARDSFSSSSGTEAWYLARAIRSRGVEVRFRFVDKVEEVVAPAIIGIQFPNGFGHFIALRERKGEQMSIGDPLIGPETLHSSELLARGEFTGFALELRAIRH